MDPHTALFIIGAGLWVLLVVVISIQDAQIKNLRRRVKLLEAKTGLDRD